MKANAFGVASVMNAQRATEVSEWSTRSERPRRMYPAPQRKEQWR